MSEFPTPKSKYTFTDEDRDLDSFESEEAFLKRMHDNEPDFHRAQQDLMDYYDAKHIQDPATAEHMAYATKDKEEALAKAYHDLDAALAEGDERTQLRLLGNPDWELKGELREQREKIDRKALEAGRDYQEKKLVAEAEDFLGNANVVAEAQDVLRKANQ